MPSYLPRFGITPTITLTEKHTRKVGKGKHRHPVRWTTSEVMTNPFYADVLDGAKRNHDAIASVNPDYKGDC
jgi:hypothetical protein